VNSYYLQTVKAIIYISNQVGCLCVFKNKLTSKDFRIKFFGAFFYLGFSYCKSYKEGVLEWCKNMMNG
jgi:hypothetical protein